METIVVGTNMPSTRHRWTPIESVGLAALCALVLLVAPATRADITGFELSKIEGVGDVTLSDRFGTTLNASEHQVNIEDCADYLGGQARFTIRLDGYNSSYVYGIAYSKPGSTCPTDHANFQGADEATCRVSGEHRDAELSSPDITFDVDLDFLTGGDCEAATDATASVTIIVEEPNLLDVQYQQVDFQVDLVPPSAPNLTTIDAGDRRFVVHWEDESNDELAVSYRVYYGSDEITEFDLETPRSIDGVEGTSVSIEDDDLVNGQVYYVRVAAIDDVENRSDLSAQLTVEPVETLDFWELYLSEGGTDPGGHCFVATAAHGSLMAPAVIALRHFRDAVLMQTSMGRAFVMTYYQWGEAPAAWIADRPLARATVRLLLWPLVMLALATLAAVTWPLGAAGGLSLVALGGALWRRRRRGGCS